MKDQYFHTERLFSEIDARSRYFNRKQFFDDEVGFKQPSDSASRLLFNSDVFDTAIAELRDLNTDESCFFLEGLLGTRHAEECEYLETLSNVATERIAQWQLLFAENFASLFTPSTVGFPIRSAETYLSFLRAEFKRFEPFAKDKKVLLHSLTAENIFSAYETMGLHRDTWISKKVTDESFQGGTAYRWKENDSAVKLGFLYSLPEKNDGFSAIEAYIMLHELGHLFHWHLTQNLPLRFFYATPELWSEGIANAFALIALHRATDSDLDKKSISEFFANQCCHGCATGLLLFGESHGSRNPEIDNEALEAAGSSLSVFSYYLSIPFSVTIADKIIQMNDEIGWAETEKFIINTHGLALHNFINTTIRERLSESET